MAFNSKWVWMNGKCVEWDNATLHVSAHGLHYGSGVFEGVRSYQTENGPAVFRMDAHLDRLYFSAQTYGIKIPYSPAQIEEGICEVIRRNRLGSCYVRPIAFLGSSHLGLHPRQSPVEVAILAWPWGPYLGDDAAVRGARITVSPWRKFDSSMMPTAAKACGQYLNSILAVQDAVARGFDEALLLNSNGTIAEGSGENVFALKDGRLITNRESDRILPGITRESVQQIARDLGWTVETRSLSLAELLASDEAFFTGTAAEVVPIAEVDGRPIGSGSRGPQTAILQKAFTEAVSGRDPRYLGWLHFVKEHSLAVDGSILSESNGQTHAGELAP